MARIAFQLRRVMGDQGSYIRYDGPSSSASSADPDDFVDDQALVDRLDVDNQLKAGGLLLPPSGGATDSYFEATTTTYGYPNPASNEPNATGRVQLKWSVPFESIKDLAEVTPQAVGYMLVYSDQGAPETISNGGILSEGYRFEEDTIVTTSFTHDGRREGRWAYYSLFVNYRNNPNATRADSNIVGDGATDPSEWAGFYERVASLAVIVPKDYGSTMGLYSRIPNHYRVADEAQGTSPDTTVIEVGDGDSPDKVTCPEYGTLPPGGKIGPLFKFLSIIGYEMDRMRTIIDHNMLAVDPDITGPETLDAVAGHFGANLSQSDLGTIRQRQMMDNLGLFRRTKGTEFGTSFFLEAVTERDVGIDVDNKTLTLYSARVNHILNPRSVLFNDRPSDRYESMTPRSPGDQLLGGDDEATAAVTLKSPVNVVELDKVVFSVHAGGSNLDNVLWARCMNLDGSPVSTPNGEAALCLYPIKVDGTHYFEIEIPYGFPGGEVYVQYGVKDWDQMRSENLNSYYLLELNHIGPYFDGDVIRGGWFKDENNTISDYRWEGGRHESRSLYADQWERTNGFLDTIREEVLPITELDKYSVLDYDAVLGDLPPSPD
jgi:hypothetical protein